jgi:hypothetical protein
MKDISQKAQDHTRTLIDKVFYHTHPQKVVIVYDTRSTLSNLLSQAYQKNLPEAIFIDFNQAEAKEILDIFATLEALDMVILIQSSNFRLDAFRIRVELFKRKIKVLEHPHLGRMAEDEVETYIDALKYDEYFIKEIGKSLKVKIDQAKSAMIKSAENTLFFPVGFEPTKLNIGDYAPMPNIGGQFPIGEVFTESKDLSAVHGRVNIFAFADLSYRINKPEKPITLIIEEGKIIQTQNSTPAFDEMIAIIKEGEEVVWVRELGFGLNRGMSKSKIISDVGSYERMCGVHLSLGAKHGMYGKPGFKRGDGKFHIDVFVDTDSVVLDDEVVFKDERWVV